MAVMWYSLLPDLKTHFGEREKKTKKKRERSYFMLGKLKKKNKLTRVKILEQLSKKELQNIKCQKYLSIPVPIQLTAPTLSFFAIASSL